MIMAPFIRVILAGFMALTFGKGAAISAEPEKIAASEPPAVTEFMGRTVAQTMHSAGANWLMRHDREQEEAGVLMRQKLDLKPGMVICDMGCGNGYHTFPMAKAVAPDGKVYGVEIQEPYLKMLDEGAKKNGVTNFIPVLGLTYDPKLPEGVMDLILLVDVYHEFDHPAEMLAAMRRALKPDGVLVFVEFRAEDASVPIKPEHKMSKAQLTKELTGNGFKLVKQFDELPWQHMMWFGKNAEH
ncbi:MAG: class I SAM-dependent methyltransferase [Verrucomicrobia bacterium]|nr:class I SAM-dependent methyltransferase [Verrucomicrobiota bacterium]